MNVLTQLRALFHPALASLTEDPHDSLDLIRQAQDPRFGDYQANFAMPLAKRLRRNPNDLARWIVAQISAPDILEPPDVAGPGFINLRLKDDWLARSLQGLAGDDRLGVPRVDRPKSVVIDYSAPNVAKPMHVGHIRSTIIGAAVDRLYRFLGHQVTSDNHVGDWGTQFGMILLGFKRFRDDARYKTDPVRELARLYQLVNAQAEQDPAVADDARLQTALLHHGDPENRKLWAEFLPHCLAEIDKVYRRLGVDFDRTHGESFYDPMLPALVDDLLAKGVARPSEGAVVIFLEDEKLPPFLIRKSDGAFTYATTDLATLKYRVESFHPDLILYVVDQRQSLHFQQLFATARRCGYGRVELVHVSFGTILGDDGRPFRTREGGVVGLEPLLDEAVARARRIVDDNSPHLSDDDRRQVAEAVGIGAIKYADLAQNRTSDYVFSWDKMLAMQGNTATYMQYAYARISSIFRKGGADPRQFRASPGPPVVLSHPTERALALALLRFPESLELAAAEYKPNAVTSYLFELADGFSGFYNACPVLQAPTDDLRQSRLALCDLTARVIQKGLDLLGIATIPQM